MKYSFEARIEANENRRKIIDYNVNRAVEVIEATIDRTAEHGYFDFSIALGNFLQDFSTKIKEEITDYLSIHGYKVNWTGNTIEVSFEEG